MAMSLRCTSGGLCAAFIATVVAVLPAAAGACPLCYGSSAPQVLNAYYLSTAVLSLLPFAIVGAIGLLALRMLRRAQAATDAEIEPSPESTR